MKLMLNQLSSMVKVLQASPTGAAMLLALVCNCLLGTALLLLLGKG